jgi:hypothetical protein
LRFWIERLESAAARGVSAIGNPKSKSRIGSAAVAQLVEHFLGKEEVKSSSLFSSFGEE